jgi:hypothetical protein
MEVPPFPLSSRAQPRDLQFRGPLLEMFFDNRSVVGDLRFFKLENNAALLQPVPGGTG